MTSINEPEEWGAAEKARLAALRREQMPPPAAVEKIVHVLKAKRLIRMTTKSQILTWPRLMGAAAAAALFLALGFGLGRWQKQPSSAPSGQALFVMFLYDTPQTSGDEDRAVLEYGRWARTVRESARRISGEKLKAGGRILRPAPQGIEILEAASLENETVLGGYFLIEAENYDDALKIAKDCPHLKNGGVIELRQIDQI